MAGPAPQDQGGDKNTYYILWVMALIVAVGAVIWYFFSEHLKAFFIYSKYFETWIMYKALSPLTYFNLPWINNIVSNLAAYMEIARNLTPDTLTGSVAEAMSTGVGEYFRYPVGIIILFIMYYTYNNHILMRCTNKHSMKSLVNQEAELWPQIEIVRKLNLVNEDLESGPWAMAMTPMQFAKKYNLIEIGLAERIGSQFSKTESPEFKITLIRPRAERVFSAQLGRPFQKVEILAPYRKAIFAILAARVGRDGKSSHKLIKQMAISAAKGSLDYSGVDELLKKHINNPAVQKILQKHAYEFTVFASLLLAAREDGVVASADFLWVKPIDRRLWYVLNNVGRQTPVVEVGGIFSHWYTELALKRLISVPDVAGAVDALQLALSDIIFVPTDKEREEIMKKINQVPQAKAEQGPQDEAEPGMST